MECKDMELMVKMSICSSVISPSVSGCREINFTTSDKSCQV